MVAPFSKVFFFYLGFLSRTFTNHRKQFPYKTAISEANVRTNRMVTTKLAHHSDRSFASNYFIFLKVLFQSKKLLMHQ